MVPARWVADMAKYGRSASKTVESAMRRKKRGTLRSGKGGKGGRVKSRKQAIAIGLSEARKKGAKGPKKKAAGEFFRPKVWLTTPRHGAVPANGGCEQSCTVFPCWIRNTGRGSIEGF